MKTNYNPLYLMLLILLALAFAAVARTPVAKPIRSMDETRAILSRLGLHWSGDLPIIVFASAGCPASNRLEKALQARDIDYLRADVLNDPLARQIHADLGRGILGNVATRATPTTVVGTTVLRTSNVEKVVEAIEDCPVKRARWYCMLCVREAHTQHTVPH